MDDSRLCEHPVTDHPLEAGLRDQVPTPAEHLLEIVTQIDVLPPQLRIGRENVKEIHVGLGRVIPPGHRTEDGKLGDAVALAQLRDALPREIHSHAVKYP
jgi:hypothetical protein